MSDTKSARHTVPLPPHSGVEVVDAGVEVVDAGNTVLGIMPLKDIRRQSLYHRAVVLLLHDRDMRLCLVRRERTSESYPNRWDLSGSCPLHEGQSRLELGEQMAGDLIPAAKVSSLRLLDDTLPPLPSTGFAFTNIVRATLPVQGAMEDAPLLHITREHMFVDREELTFLLEEYRDLFTPRVTLCWERGVLFP